MREQFVQFLESPNRESYLMVRTALFASEEFDPYSNELSDVYKLLDAGEWEAARETLSRAMSNLLLSPRAHGLLSMIAERLGDERGARVESLIAAACAEGIHTTGDGTRESPYLAVRTSDEHDLVQFLGKTFAEQTLVHEQGRSFDRIRCQDGSELWFDITDTFRRLRTGLE